MATISQTVKNKVQQATQNILNQNKPQTSVPYPGMTANNNNTPSTQSVPMPPQSTAPKINNTYSPSVSSTPQSTVPMPPQKTNNTASNVSVVGATVVPMPPKNTSVPTPPQTNYGGQGNVYNELLYSKKQYDAGNKNWAMNNANQYYGQLSPEEANLIRGMNTQQLTDYINNRNKVESTTNAPVQVPTPDGTFTYTPPNESQVPIYNPALPVRDTEALWKYVDGQFDRKLSDLRLYADQQTRAGQTIADQQLAANQTQYDRAQQTIGENRALENVSNARNLSPFSGRSDYAQGMIAQERARTDREAQQDLSSRQANINADLANLRNSIEEKYAAMQNAAPAEREALFQQLLNDERMYDLAVNGQQIEGLMANSQLNNTAFNQALQTFQTNRGVFESDRNFDLAEGGLTGQYNGASTLAGKQANWNAYLDMVDRTGNLGKGPAQNWTNLVNNANAGGQTLSGRQYDRNIFESDRNYDRGVYESDRNYDYQVGRDAVADEQFMKKFNEDVRQFGLQHALQRNAQAISAANQRSDNSRASSNAEFNRLMDIWKATGVAPAGIQGVAPGTPYGGGNPSGISEKMMDESRSMVDAIRTGGMTPEAAYTQIDEDIKLGFYTPQEGAYLKSTLEQIGRNQPKAPLTESQQEIVDSLPSDSEIDRIWKTEGKGTPMLDFRSWYKSPQGRLGGIDFNTWNKIYGPRLGSG